MSINTGDNFRYQGKKYLDDRQSFKTLDELMAYTNVPPGFIAYCEENGQRYEYVNDTWVLYKVSTDTSDLDLSNYALKTDIPTKTSELENDSEFVNQDDFDISMSNINESTNKLNDRMGLKTNNSISVAEIISVAKSYYNVRTKEDGTPLFIYDTGHTPLSDSYNPNDETYAGAIDCSTYIGLVLRGIPFLKSPYSHLVTGVENDSNGDIIEDNVTGDETGDDGVDTEVWDPSLIVENKNDYPWAINPFNWELPTTQSSSPTPIRRASQLAQWMFERGMSIPLDETFSNLEPGDIIFWAKTDSDGNYTQPNRYKHISHVALCIGKYDPPIDDEKFPTKYPFKHTMLEVTTIAPYVLNRTLEKVRPNEVVMICRPDLGSILTENFAGNIKTQWGIDNISKLYRPGIYYLTSSVIGGLPDNLTNGIYLTLKVERTITKQGKTYSLIQTLINAKTNKSAYRRTQYCYSHLPNETSWTSWTALDMTKENIESILTGNITTHTHEQYLSEVPSEYITETDLEQYATKDYVIDNINNASINGGYVHPDTHPASMITGLSNVATSGNYNDLNNKPITPTKTSQLINDSGFVTSDNIQNIDLDNYATKAELPTKLSQLENDSGYLKEADIHTHENKTVLDSITADKVNKWDNPNYNDLSNKPSIPNKVSQLTNDLEFVTREYMQNYVPDLSGVDLTIINEMLEGKFDDVMINDEESTDNQTAVDFYANEKVVKTLYLPKGGGGTTASAYISTTLPENVTIETGHDFELLLDFASPNAGRGTLKVFINDVDSLSTSINQGESTTVISNTLLTKGVNKMVVYVLDRRGVMSNSLTFYIRYGSTEITSTFDPYTAYDYGSVIRYYFTPTALDTSLTLTFYMKIDGVTQTGVTCTSDVRSYYTFPSNLSVGKHYCEAWINDGTSNSNVLKFNLIILDNSSLVVASDTQNVTMEEGEQLSLDYRVYMKNNVTFITKTYIDSELVNTGTCGLATSYFKSSSLSEGIHTIKIEVWDMTESVSDYVSWTVTITPSTFEMKEPVTTGSVFIATAKNRTNSVENRDVWVGHNQDNQEINATLYNFAFNSNSGWMDNQLLITGNSYVEIPVKPLSGNARYGFTLDIEFMTKPIGVDNAEVLTLWNDTDNCGIKITTEECILRSKSGGQCKLYFTEEEVVSAMFVIDRDEKTAKIYLNGVMCEAFSLSDYVVEGVPYLEDFTVNTNVYLGGKDKDGYSAIKNIRIYEIALSTDEIINNFIANKISKSEQQELVEFQKGNNLPTLTVYGDFSGLGKDDKKPCDIIYLSPDVNKYGEGFSYTGKNCLLQYQGTSSMQYPIKNYRLNLRDENGKKKKYNFPGSKPEARFTLKADFMSSGHWQNTGLAKWINDNLYGYDVNNEKSMNPFKWYEIQNGGTLKDSRETINGFPCRLILVNDGQTPLAPGQEEPTPGNTKDMGVFNFNNDKDNTSTFGFNSDIFPNCASYEVVANSDTSAGAFFSFVPPSKVTFENDYYITDKIPIDERNITIVSDVSVVRVYEYDANGMAVYNTSFDSNNITMELSSTTRSIRLRYSTEPYNTSVIINGKKHDLVSESDITPDLELNYYKDSFELRYPDEDDVGSDFGYLGLKVEALAVDYYMNGSYYVTTYIDVTDKVSLTFGDVRPISIECTTNTGGWVTTSNNIGETYSIPEGTARIAMKFRTKDNFIMNGVEYIINEKVSNYTVKDPYTILVDSPDYGLKRLINWVDNSSDEEFVSDFENYFLKDYVFRYYILVIVLGMVDNLGKNMMLDTADHKIWFPRFYDMDTICSYDNSGAIKFDVDIEMEQGYWNTSGSRLWTRVRDLFHDELVLKYNDMRKNGLNYDKFMEYFYDQQIAQIPQSYYNKDFDVKYAPYADTYLGKAHGDGYEHLKRWLKNRIIFTDTLFDYAPSYTADMLTIRANTTEPMNITIETYTPVYQHVSFYNGNMEKNKITKGNSFTFTGKAQTATDQEVLIYGGSNIKRITGISTMNPNSMLIGGATRLIELDVSNCPILTDINSNKANLSAHTYLSKLSLNNCPQLGGTLRLNNSPLLKEIDIQGTAIDGLLLPSSLRNLEVLKLNDNIPSLTLNDASSLTTLEFEEGGNLQSLSLSNCNKLTNSNIDLTKIPSLSLDNSFDKEEFYLSEVTNLTLKNMPSLKRLIFTPNNEYAEFDINNVINGKNYKVTTFNNPNMKEFITTAPHRNSYNDCEATEQIIPGVTAGTYETQFNNQYTQGGYWDTNGNYIESTTYYLYEYEFPPYVSEVKLKANVVASAKPYVRCTYFNGEKYIDQYTINNSSAFEQVIEVPEKCNKIIFVADLGRLVSCSYTITEDIPEKTLIIKDYGDIKPNTVFSANTLDLSSSQFSDIKLLCTTDVYNLKVPTTMKNFYCDSAMDIDTNIIEDATYEKIHNNLIEEYTTNYDKEVGEKIITTVTALVKDLCTNTGWLDTSNNLNTGTTSYKYSDYIPCAPGGNFNSGNVGIASVLQYDENKTFLKGEAWITNTTLLDNCSYIRLCQESTYIQTREVSYDIIETITPNIIPSSASGSLIFNLYSNNTTQPTSTSPYMWDLTGLKLNDFYTFGMNNNIIGGKVSKSYEFATPNNKNYGEDLTYKGDVTIYFDYDKLGNLTQTPYKTVSFCKTTGEGSYFVVIRNDGIYTYVGKYVLSNLLSYTFSNENTHFEIKFNAEKIDVIANGSLLLSKNLSELTPLTASPQNTRQGNTVNFESYGTQKFYYEYESSITMPQRLPGYSIRMVNADITPNNYANHLYPLLVDTTLPITGKLDYSKYQGTSLAWAYAYTTNDVAITPLGSQQQGNITNDYNKLYGTDYVDIVDVWAYKDDDFSNKSTNEAITKAYIELTSTNYKTRIDEVLQWYPNCTDLYLFEDGSVTNLREMFFNGNTNVRNQILKVEFIEGYFTGVTDMTRTFQNCSSLTIVPTIPNNVTDITNAFFNCKSLTTAPAIPDSVTSMSNTFQYCIALTTVPNIGNNVIYMQNTFYGCSSLTTAPTIPNSVTDMSNAFNGCSSLTTVPNIPNSVTNMLSTFYGCSSLTTVPNLPDSVTTMQSTFHGCNSLTTIPNIPDRVTNMSYAFQGCTSLTTVPNIPNSVTNMQNTFQGCTSLTTVPNIPNSVTNMVNTFYGCTSLTKCSIPLTKLTNYVDCLANCSSLTNITWVGERTTDFSLATLGAPSYTEADIKELVPEHLGTVESATLDLGEHGSSLEPADVFGANQKGWTIVGVNMEFMIINKDFDVSSMVDDDSVTSCFIELTNSNKSSRIDSVLNHLPNCTSINLYEDGTVTTLSNLISRKTSSSKITEVSFVEGNFNNVTNMEYAFQDCTSLTKVNNIPKSVTSLECTFKGCSKLVTSPPIHDGVTNMYYTFWECISLVNAPDIPNTVTDIYGCFRSCWKLKTGPLTMPDEVETISYLFKDCRVLETVPALPKRCVGGNMISPSAIETFLDCKRLTTVPPSMPDGIIDVTSCFQGATKLVNAPTFPDTVVIMKSAFMYDTSIQNVVVPPNVYNYWNVCFGCSALREVTLPLGALTSSSDTKFSDALYNCGNITNITWTGTLRVNYSLSTLCATSYTSQDVKELVNEHLGTVESATLTLGEYGSYLTPAEVFSAKQKGWTITGANMDFTIINSNDDVSGLTTDESITNCFIELTSSNYKTRIDEVLQWYPNCTDLYLFDDGSVTSLDDMFNDNNTSAKTKIVTVRFVEGYFSSLDSMANTFYKCSKLTTVSNIPDGVTDMNSTFYSCTSLTTVPNIPSSVTDMSYTFGGCTSLTTAPTIPDSVTNMSYTFRKCSKLTTAPNIGNGVTNMQSTFEGCASLTTVPNIPNNVTNMSYTFQNCTSLTTAPTIPNSVTNMDGTFYGCSALTSVPNIPNGVTGMSYAFYNCSALTECSIPLTNITNYSSCLKNCSALTNITWTGERTTNFSLTTLNAPSYTQIDIKELVPEHLGTVESATLTLGATYLAYLTEEEIASAVAKGWTLQ